MKKKNIYLSLFAICVVALGFVVFKLDVAYASDPYSLLDVAKQSGLDKGGEGVGIAGLIGQVLGAILSMVGVIFFVLMIYGGIMWMTSAGNEQKTGTALKTIISAAVGMVIVMSSYIIVNFVFTLAQPGAGSAGSSQCASLLAGLGNPPPDGSACTTIAGGVALSPDGSMCISYDDTLCNSQCGGSFNCMNRTLCKTGVTPLRFYCTGGDDYVCCEPETNIK